MTRPSFTICICPDSQLLRDRLDALAAEYPYGENAMTAGGLPGMAPPLPASWQRFVFWADEGLQTSFWEHLTLQGLFATPKILILRNAQNLPVDTLRQLDSVLIPMASGRASSLLWPMLCFEVGFEKGKAKVPVHVLRLPFWQLAEQKNWIDEVPGLTPQSLPAYIRREAARHGIAASAQEINRLAQALPPDAALISSELAKLALSTDAHGKLPANAFELAEHSRELGLFELIRLIQQNTQTSAAWRHILDDAQSGDSMVFPLISLVLREARVLWQCLAGQPPFLPSQVAMQKKQIAQSLGFAGIARLWEIALMADKGIKTGERSPDQACQMLTADLFALFGQKSISRI